VASHKVFLLSPANTSGIRGSWLLRRGAKSALAQRLRSSEGASIGEVYTFISGLYFRGKLAYSGAFAAPPAGVPGTHVIVPGLGLVAPETMIDLAELQAIAKIPVDHRERKFVKPLARDAEALAAQLSDEHVVVLLGSIATKKYLEPLTAILGARLHVPVEFKGRGDMSRGAMMLRATRGGQELIYVACADI
jgi:hypothetical protein